MDNALEDHGLETCTLKTTDVTSQGQKFYKKYNFNFSAIESKSMFREPEGGKEGGGGMA